MVTMINPQTTGFWDAVSRTHLRACIALFIIAFACLTVGFTTLQPMDRDESRFAQASKQMVETGDYVDIRFQEEARHKKPIGIYWAQSSVVRIAEVLGVQEARLKIWLYRIPSLIGAFGAVFATYWAGLVVFNRFGALLAALMLSTSVLLSVEARLAKTDALLLLCITLTMGILLRLYMHKHETLCKKHITLFWVATAAGILIKGPILVLVIGLAIAGLCIWERSAKWLLPLKPFWGLLITLVLVSPWFIAIALKSNGAFFAESVGKDMLAKVGGAQEKHGAPPGFYLITFFATFWPSSLLIAMAAPASWKLRHEPLVRFALAWIVPTWLLFELVPTKLPHYILPLFPVIALLTVRILCEPPASLYRWGTKTLSAFIWIIPMAAFLALSIFVWQTEHRILLSALPFVVISGALAWLSWRYICRQEPLKALPIACIAALPFSWGVFLSLPTLETLRMSPQLANSVKEVMRENPACKNPQIVTAGYREPSLVFLVGTHLKMQNGEEAAAFLKGDGCKIAFIAEKERARFEQGIINHAITPKRFQTIKGFNKNGGRKMTIDVYIQ